MISDEFLPIELPEVDKYLPTEDGEPPLARATKEAWNHFQGDRMEHNTMPGWAGSSWYFLRYMDPKNANEFVSKERSDYWGQVDLYIGGAEHATGHLLYARFWQKFLYDLNVVPVDEFAKKLINQGMILGTSAFVGRIEGTNTYISVDQITNETIQWIHADVSFVNSSDELDVVAFKTWREEFNTAIFITGDNHLFKVKERLKKCLNLNIT